MTPLFAIGLPHGLEWLWIALIVVLLFGAEKLPKLARGLGRSLGEFKKAKEEFDKEVKNATDQSTPENQVHIDPPKSIPTIPATAIRVETELSKKS